MPHTGMQKNLDYCNYLPPTPFPKKIKDDLILAMLMLKL